MDSIITIVIVFAFSVVSFISGFVTGYEKGYDYGYIEGRHRR